MKVEGKERQNKKRIDKIRREKKQVFGMAVAVAQSGGCGGSVAVTNDNKRRSLLFYKEGSGRENGESRDEPRTHGVQQNAAECGRMLRASLLVLGLQGVMEHLQSSGFVVLSEIPKRERTQRTLNPHFWCSHGRCFHHFCLC